MMDGFQRGLTRFAAIAAILLGATVAIVLAAVTLLTGVVIGLIAAGAAWFSLRGRRRVPGSGGAGRHRPREVTVIDVEMRELEPGERRAGARPTGERPTGERPTDERSTGERSSSTFN